MLLLVGPWLEARKGWTHSHGDLSSIESSRVGAGQDRAGEQVSTEREGERERDEQGGKSREEDGRSSRQ